MATAGKGNIDERVAAAASDRPGTRKTAVSVADRETTGYAEFYRVEIATAVNNSNSTVQHVSN